MAANFARLAKTPDVGHVQAATMAASSSGLLLRDMPGDDDPLGLSVSAGPAKRLRSSPSACSTLGPSSYEALLNWGTDAFAKLTDHAAACGLADKFGSFPRRGKLWLTTSYSGVCTVEHVMCFVVSGRR